MPTGILVRVLRLKNCSYRIASEILHKQLKAVENEIDTADKDIVNLLGLCICIHYDMYSNVYGPTAHSYLAEDPDKRMSVDEIYSQLA